MAILTPAKTRAKRETTNFKFPELKPTPRERPFTGNAPVLSNYPLENYSTLKEWVEAIALVQWQWIEDEIVRFFKAEDDWVLYPKQAAIPYKTGWYFYGKQSTQWTPLESLDQIPLFMVSDTESCRPNGTERYKPFLYGGLAVDGWYMWHCNDMVLPDQIPFPPGRVILGHNFAAYDSRFLSCEQSTENGRRSTILDTMSWVTRYRGLSNQQTAKYKLMGARVAEGKPADPWYQHACSAGLDEVVFRLLGIKIDKGVRDAMTAYYWEQLYDEVPPTTIFEYWSQDVVYTAKVAKKLFYELRQRFLPSAATWLGMAEMSSCRLWLKDWPEFLQKTDTRWRAEKDSLCNIVKAAADSLRGNPDAPTTHRQYVDCVQFVSELNETYSTLPEVEPKVIVNQLPGSAFEVFIPQHDSERGFVIDKESMDFGFLPCEEPTPSQLDTWAKKQRAVYNSLAQIAKDPSNLAAEQGDLITKLSAVFKGFTPVKNKAGVFDWTPTRSGTHKGVPVWYKKLASSGTTKNPKDPFSLGTQAAVFLLGLLWEGQPMDYIKIGNKGGWVDNNGKPLPHPSGGENLGTPFCKDYLAYVTSDTLSSSVLSKEELVDVFKSILLTGQWSQFRGRYHDVYTHESQYEGLHFVKPGINPAGTVTGRAKSSVWVVTPNEKEIFDGSIKLGSDMQNQIVPPPGYQVVGADFTSEESWLATLVADAQAGEVASNPWCQSVLYGDKAQKTDIHSIVATVLDVDRQSGKGLNFSSQYGAGVIKLITLLMLAGIPYEVAEHKAQQFISFLKGPQGIARRVFATLRALSERPGIRTAILGCRVPESLDAKYCGRNFITSRNNWIIQSAGVDVIHTLLTILNAFLMEYEVDAFLMLHRHDAVYYVVKKGQEDLFQRCLQQAHYLTKQFAYEQAVAQANALNKSAGYTVSVECPPLECPDSQKWFDDVKVKPTVGAAG